MTTEARGAGMSGEDARRAASASSSSGTAANPAASAAFNNASNFMASTPAESDKVFASRRLRLATGLPPDGSARTGGIPLSHSQTLAMYKERASRNFSAKSTKDLVCRNCEIRVRRSARLPGLPEVSKPVDGGRILERRPDLLANAVEGAKEPCTGVVGAGRLAHENAQNAPR